MRLGQAVRRTPALFEPINCRAKSSRPLLLAAIEHIHVDELVLLNLNRNDARAKIVCDRIGDAVPPALVYEDLLPR